MKRIGAFHAKINHADGANECFVIK